MEEHSSRTKSNKKNANTHLNVYIYAEYCTALYISWKINWKSLAEIEEEKKHTKTREKFETFELENLNALNANFIGFTW